MTTKWQRFGAWLRRLRFNMREHPAAPWMARTAIYALLLLGALVLAIALRESPLRGYSALLAAVAAIVLGRKLLRALRRGNEIMRPDDHPGLFRRMFSVLKDVKRL